LRAAVLEIIKYLVEFEQQKRQIAVILLIIVVVLGLIPSLAGLGLLMSFMTTSYSPGNLVFLLALSMPAIIASNIHNIATAFLYTEYNEGRAEIIEVIRKILFLTGSLVLAYLGYGLIGIGFFLFISPLLTGLVGIYYYEKITDFLSRKQSFQATGHIKPILRFGFLILLINFFMNLHLHLDVILVEIFQNSRQTGIYKGMSVLSHFLWIIPAATAEIALHNFSDMSSNSEIKKIRHFVEFIISKQVAFLALLGVGMLVLAEPFIALYYGGSFLPGAIVLQLLTVGSVLGASSTIISPTLEATGNIVDAVKAAGLAAMLNVILNIFLIPYYGMIGAAIATSISYASMMVVYSYYYSSHMGYNPLLKVKWRKIAFSVGITFLILSVFKNIFNSPLSQIIILPPLGAFVYILLSIRLGILNSSEVREFGQILGIKPKYLNKVLDVVEWIEYN